MKITKPGHTNRRRKVIAQWLKIAGEISGGKSVAEVAKAFTNPRTGRAYSRGAIYYILEQLEVIA